MSEISDKIQSKCLAFGDRIIKLNDYLLEQASKREDVRSKKEKRSIGANNAEACNAISKADFKSKSFIALKEARESLYWIDLLHRNGYLNDKQYESIYTDGEELVKILVARCKKLNQDADSKDDVKNKEMETW